MRIEQEWEGYVVDIGLSEFVARLVDLTAGSSHEEEEAIVPVAQISDHDAARLRLGSIFRWVIGYESSAVESGNVGLPDRVPRPSQGDQNGPAGRQGMGA